MQMTVGGNENKRSDEQKLFQVFMERKCDEDKRTMFG
jgi:hypothetical protein